ncbi:hypothetical protein L1049_026917 [Liquidambar formosana]|uniref:DIS3-like exonuclease 2 n=1 Tax=Liquidambar formosana TaxID=63359 RepID=A0AAP0NFS3_LIQFO
MRGGMVVDQSVVERAEDGDKEKKKKRRPRRKPNASLSACSSNSEIRAEGSECLGNGSGSNHVTSSIGYSSSKHNGVGSDPSSEHGVTKASDVAFNSMPTMHINEQVDLMEVGNTHSQHQFPSDLGGRTGSKSCPVPIACQEPIGSFTNKDFLPSQQIEGYAQSKYFAPHWSMEAVNEALEKGDAFKALFRVNAHNRLEAYCKIDGVPTDILISGIAAQNRAVEGDTVAVKVDPLSLWTRMKGSAGIVNNSALMEDYNLLPEVTEMVGDRYKGKNIVDADYEYDHCRDRMFLHEEEFHHRDCALTGERRADFNYVNGHYPSASDSIHFGCSSEHNEVTNSLGKICAMISSFPFKRPTGKVVAIIERSPRRDAVVGFLGVKQWLSYSEIYRKATKKNKNSLPLSDHEYIQLSPTDPKFPKMVVPMRGLPDCIKKRLKDGDLTVEMELVAARIGDWEEVSLVPQAFVNHIFGRGGEIEPNIAAILFENAICSSEFSPESLACLPRFPWEVPQEEFKTRRDLRNLCIFTIDPSTATDLDDALSVESLSDGIFRVGVHIADASYFVLPDSALDLEAQIRSTSVYLLQRKLPMLPSLLSENIGSLIPGVDRLAFSIFWDINLAGDVVDRWIGRTIIRSCCKLSYEHAQDIIDGLIDVEGFNTLCSGYPQLHGHCGWPDVIRSVKSLHEISVTLKDNRFNDGALRLDSSKMVFLFDKDGIPYDSLLCEQKSSNSLVEEFMLLANRTAAEVISRAFPDSALLRRHPEPNLRKLREFEVFCSKHGLELDTSSGQLHHSLELIREKLKNDSVLFEILISYASRPMQLATYFCSGDFKGSENDWGHYALAVPLYTHFTSPLRRYPDIVVHRTLAAAIDAEEMYLMRQRTLQKMNKGNEMTRCFTGIYFDKDAAESMEGQEALSAAALKHRVPCTKILADVTAYCNQRKLASRHAEDACERLYVWALLKKKEILLSEARVLGLGPRFMSIYIHKLAIERRIYYDEVEGLMVEWLDATSTLVLNFCTHKRSHRRGSPGRYRTLEDVALVVSPYNMQSEMGAIGDGVQKCSATQIGDAGVALQEPKPMSKYGVPDITECDPAVFPLTVRLLSTIPVALHAGWWG